MNTLMRLTVLGALLAAGLLPAPAAADVNFTLNSGFNAQEQARIRAAHARALQTVEDALAYLRSTGFYALHGLDPRYNATFGQFYDNSAANPLLGQYSNTTLTRRVSSTSTYLASNMSSSATTGNGTITFPTGTGFQGDIFPLGEVYVRLPDVLYDSRDVSPSNTGGIATVTGVTTAQVTSGGGSGQTQVSRTELRTVTYDRFTPPELPFLVGTPLPPERVVHPVTGAAELIDAARFNELVDTMESIRNALLADVTYDGWQNNANGILAELDTTSLFAPVIPAGTVLPNGTVVPADITISRGFEQYGFSNSDSALHAQNLLDLQLGTTTSILEWWEDTIDADNNGIPDADSAFFNEKFTALADGSTIYLGDSALTETQTAGGLFDNSIRTDLSSTDELYKLIIEAVAADVGGTDLFGNDLYTYNREEIAGFLGDPNVDPYFLGDVFPQDLDVTNIAEFAAIADNISQGGPVGAQAFGPPPGHISFASPFGLDLLIPRN